MTQEKLGKKIGVTKATIYNWESGKRFPSRSNMGKLASALSVKIETLQVDGVPAQDIPALTLITSGTTDNIAPAATHTLSAGPLRSVPVISWVQAGELQEVEDPYPPGCGDRDVLSDCKDLNCFALEVVGCSMATRYHPGDTIIVSPNEQWHSGSHVIARVKRDDGVYEATFKELQIKGEPPDALYILAPLNPEYDKRVFEKPPDGHWQIVGVVVDMKPNLHNRNGC